MLGKMNDLANIFRPTETWTNPSVLDLLSDPEVYEVRCVIRLLE